MSKLKKYIGFCFNDGKLLSELWGMFEKYDFPKVLSNTDLNSFKEILDKAVNVSNYVVITNDRKNAHGLFVSNNIIDITDKTSEQIYKEANWILTEFGKEDKMTDKIFFTSDTHFNHSSIIKYCNRPYNSGFDSENNMIITEDDVNRMNEDIIKRWNSVVPKDGIVWHLGDFCLGKNQKENIQNIVSRLNGKINLIIGNHDHHSIKSYYDWGFNRVYDRQVIINKFVILSHAPIEFLNDNCPFFNIFGHVHDSDMYKTYSKNSCCVCVERHDYKPIPWIEIEKHYLEINKED